MQLALNEKMADFTANAKQFTMDGGIVYEFKDEDDYKTAKKDLSHLKKAMASNWVEQPRQRKVRVGYNESEFLKASMKATKEEKVKGPRLTKMPQLNDFQFFNTQRIEELYGIEHAHENWKFQQHHRRLELEKANMSPEEIEAELNKCFFLLYLFGALATVLGYFRNYCIAVLHTLLEAVLSMHVKAVSSGIVIHIIHIIYLFICYMLECVGTIWLLKWGSAYTHVGVRLVLQWLWEANHQNRNCLGFLADI
jgi:hypothetical protein